MALTPDQIAVLGIVLSLLSGANIIITWVRTAQTPDKERDQKIANLGTKIDVVDRKIDDGLTDVRREINDKVGTLERKMDDKVKDYDVDIKENLESINSVRCTMLYSTTILLRSQLALISHELDGNNTAGLQKSREELDDYVRDTLEGKVHDCKIHEKS